MALYPRLPTLREEIVRGETRVAGRQDKQAQWQQTHFRRLTLLSSRWGVRSRGSTGKSAPSALRCRGRTKLVLFAAVLGDEVAGRRAQSPFGVQPLLFGGGHQGQQVLPQFLFGGETGISCCIC